jgi:hypothetical protein
MCNAAIAFNRKIKKDGKDLLLTFGISGLLMHNDKIMYDKQTNTWWEQLMGEAIVGELAGTELKNDASFNYFSKRLLRPIS